MPGDILPLHGNSDGSLGEMLKTIRSYSRNIARRLTPTRIIIIVCTILAFYTFAGSIFLSTQRDIKKPSANPSFEELRNRREKNSPMLMDRKTKAERERALLEWETRANYRTDLTEAGPGRVSAFSPSLFSAPAPISSLSGPDRTSKFIPVTAVLLSWKRKEGAKAVVAHLRKYPFIKEILIWNNNPDFALELSDFGETRGANGTVKSPSISLFNSVANIHDFAKYTTCVLAKYDHCYIQDDDWINLSMDSMYTAYIDAPDSLLTNTIPSMFAQQRSWMFQNPKIGLHTGFSWLGCGSFIPKKTVFRFQQQLGGSNLWKEQITLSDLFFTLWRNQYPTVLSQALAPLDQSSSWSGNIDQWNVVYQHLKYAMERLTTVLAGEGSIEGSPHRKGAKTDFIAEEETPFKDRYLRSSCGNDKCLFQTNSDLFPSPESVKWPITSEDWDIHAHEDNYQALDYPSPEFIAMHTYHYAVDGDLSTCWRSYQNMGRGGFFGLQFVRPLQELHQDLTLDIVGEHTGAIEIWSTLPETLQALQHSTVIKVSTDGHIWLACAAKTEATDGSVRFSGLNCGTDGLKQDPKFIQHLRFELRENIAKPVEVCGIRVAGMIL
ncbi:hypothetical protein BGZ93_007741 [Podila epicladia]|nr:hypothetical protein BGZ92_001245 [Podila epicladia]KAG0093752.1 hypothetical protein BGZ93_007741 [Podila epicladia]